MPKITGGGTWIPSAPPVSALLSRSTIITTDWKTSVTQPTGRNSAQSFYASVLNTFNNWNTSVSQIYDAAKREVVRRQARLGHPDRQRVRVLLDVGELAVPAGPLVVPVPVGVLGEPHARECVNADDIAGLIIAALLLGYLIFALIAPEKL